MPFIDGNGSIAAILSSSIEVTGSIGMTLWIIVIIILAFCLLFRIPIEFTIPIIMPLILACWAYYPGDFLTIGGLMLMYMSVIFVKNLPING